MCPYCQDTVEHESMKEAMEKGRKSIDIHDCLELFTQEEKLGEDDPWWAVMCMPVYVYMHADMLIHTVQYSTCIVLMHCQAKPYTLLDGCMSMEE